MWKMSQTWHSLPWQWPLEWFNKTLLFPVYCHHPGEASCQNREKVTEHILNKWTISGKIGEVANLDLSELEKWHLERFNQIQLWVVNWYHPWEGSCQNREKVTVQCFCENGVKCNKRPTGLIAPPFIIGFLDTENLPKVQTLLKITHLASRKSCLVIICPNSYETLTKVKYSQIGVDSNIAQNHSSSL